MDEMVLTPPPSRFADWRQRERVAPSPALGSGEVWLAADASQRRLWMQEQLEPGNGRYNCPHALRVLGPLQLPALEQALERLAQRHEALRSSFAVDAQGVLRRRVEPTRPTPLALVDVSAGALSEVGLQRLLRDLLARPFDLGTGPLWRAACVRLGPGEHVLCFSAHHAIVDDWSIGLLLRELTRDVAAMLLGHPLPLDAAPTAAPRTDPDRTDRSLAYWRERLAGVPVLLLPGDRARRQRPTRPAAKVFDRFPADLAQAIDTRARALGISAFSAYLTALRSVLSTWSRQQDFTIGLPAFDRPNGVAERQVGLAVNLLALRRSLVAEARFWPAAAEEFETVLAGLEHRDAPFDQVVEAVAADRVAGTDPLVQVMYAHHERDGGHFSVGACTFSPVDVVMPLARFELTLMTVRQRDGVSVSMEYDADLYDADSMQALLADLRQVLTVAAADANAPLRPPPHQPARLVGPPPALDRPAHSLATRLRHAFAARPDGVALRHEGAQYTCRWLSARAEGIARKLRQEGAGADTVVAIAMRRGPAQLAAACGAVMAGAAFALFDPDVPMERLLRLLGTLAPRWLLVSRQGPAPLAPAGIRILEVEGVPVAAPSREEPCWSPEGLAYVVATSGSTGQHKLIGVPWAALLNRLAWMQSVEPWYDDERAMSRTQTMFVDFICEAFAPLLGGVPLIMAGAEQLADAQALVALMRRERATRLVATPSLLRELAAVVRMRQNGGLPDLRVAVASGEALTAQDVALVRSLTAARLWNLYGSCEVAADATAALIATTLDATAPIGQPIAGMQAWLTDAQGQAVPARALGEIQLAGIGLARGYLGDPAATAAAFRPAPTHAGHGARAFVTGDHGRIDASGALHFAGREAGRVELRGIRVEIHEMEALLRDDPEVAQAAVVVVDVPRRAVARVLPRGQQLDAQALRRRLLARAPAYLVPSQIEVGELPRTPSGKIDYVALRQCPRSAPSEGPPATPDELALAAAWSEVLHCAVDDRGADFFALGGHSLAATRVARLLERRLGRTVPPALSLLTPILKEAALELAACPTSGSETIAPDAAHRFEPFPLHPLQAAYVAGRDAAFEGGGVSLHGYSEIEWPGVSVDAFEDALNVLIGRHDMLRAVLLEDLSQRVLPQVPRYRIERVDLRGLPLAQIEAGRARLRREMGAQVLDLRRWPSFDIRSSQVDAGPPRLHVSFDGVFVDAWSQSLLLREMVRILRDGDPGWRAPGLAYRDWLLHQAARRQSLSRERAWADWQARLAGLPDAPEMPRPERQPPAGPPRIAQIGVDIPPEVVQRLREQVAGDGNLVTVLLAAFAVVLGRWAASPRFLLNVPLSGRGTEHDDIDRLIGPFGDFTLVAFDLELTPGWRDLVRAARRELSWALERQQVSGMDLSRALREQRGGQVLTPIVFTSLNFETGTGAAPAESAFEELFSTGQTPQVHLDNRVRLLADGSVRIAWDVAVDQFPPGLPEAMLRVYEEVLHRAAQADWEQPLTLGDDPVPMSTSGHAHAQADAVPAPARLDAAFQAGVQRHARRAAVVFAGGQWSYEELWARVQGVAARLLAQGLGRGDVVAVALDKGPAQVAAVLGILHIGAAYAPLEPEHPAERLEALLVSLQARAVLVQARDVNAPWRATALAVPVEAAMAEGLAGAQARVEPVPDAAGQDAQALAYVIHTSGSTGRPKGVMISHAAAWATIAAVNERLALTPQDRVLSVSALGFDLSVWDLFGPLSVGAAVVMPDAQGARDPGAWLALAGQAGVTIWNSAPGLMGAVLERAGAGLRGLRWALLSGDFIPLGMPAAIRAGAPGCRVLSLGGATEAAIWSVWYEVAEVKPEWRSIPYGRALPGQQAYVVDARLRLCPSWVEGEIVIAGGGLAQGYWRQPQETAARFITHPRTGQRLYRTGDRGRYRADGEIEILGRMDRQVKINGHRIEPGEVEAALLASGELAHCIVVPHRDEGRPAQLVAHVVRRTPVDPANAPAQAAAPRPATARDRTEGPALGTGRRALPDAARVSLGVQVQELAAEALARRSRRAFQAIPLRRRALGGLLLQLAEIAHERLPLPKRLYGSAGHLYPVQTYVAIRPGAVAGLDAGYYYLDPADVHLVRLGDFNAQDDGLIAGTNKLLFASAAFVLLFVADLTEVRERYGPEAERFAAVEAGLMAQLLETAAPQFGLGLCQVGGMDRERVAVRCQLTPAQLVLHAIVGGPVDVQADPLADLHGWRRSAHATAGWLRDRRVEELLREQAQARLPRPLRPARFVFWEQLPLTSNGKVDHAALQAAAQPPAITPEPVLSTGEPATRAVNSQPAAALQAPRASTTPVNDESPNEATLHRLLALWRLVLGDDQAGTQDSFLALGGNSLQALRLLALVEQEFGRAPSVGDFLSRPTVTGLHELLSHLPVVGTVRRTAELQQGGQSAAPFALNPMQQAYVVSRAGVMAGGMRAARNYFEVDFEGLNLARLERAIRRLIGRHGMLRARFSPPTLRVPDEAPYYALPSEDLTGLEEAAIAPRLREIRRTMEARVVEVHQWPLFDLYAAQLPQGRTRLHFALDLLICDARSFQILHEDLMRYYEADGADDPLPALAISYRDHAIALDVLREGPRGDIDRRYWMDRLATLAPPVRLPVVAPGCAPDRQDVDGRQPATAMFERLTARMTPDRFARLRALGATHGATASGLLCAAFSRVLSVWNGRAPFTLNLTTFGREPIHPDVDHLVGEFTSSTLLEVDPSADRFATLARDTQRRILSDLEHRSFTGTEVLRLLNRREGRVGHYEASVVFTSLVGVTLHAAPMAPGLSSTLVHAVSQTPQVLLDHQVFDLDGALVYNWDYAADRFPEGVVEDMFATYTEFLDRLVDEPDLWTRLD